MRGYLGSSIGVTCAAALALPLAPPAAAASARPAPPAEAPATGEAGRTGQPAPAADRSYAPGGTQSLPLQPLPGDRAPGVAEQGLPARDVQRFSLVGVVWDEPDTELHGRVQVRTRATATGAWSPWQDLETHHADHGADPGTAERTSGRVRGATAPLWVGESDGVQVRVRAEGGDGLRAGGVPAAGGLPTGLRLELVDPGADTAPAQGASTAERSRTGAPGARPAEAAAATASGAGPAPRGAAGIPALSRAGTERELRSGALTGQQQKTKPYIGPRPAIVTRSGWKADETLREKTFVYTKKVKAAFVHHTASGNNYTCAQAPSVIRSIYRYHVGSMGWRDIGYNFLVDKCGKIYEGRAGGVAKPVLGAHTLGFNTNSMGVAVIGTYSSTKPSSSAVNAVAQLAAWKLGLHGMNPKGKTSLTSGGGNLYPKGKSVRLNVISGHRDGFLTACPGGKLYGKLGTARSTAAKYQGR
ncbi:peptidoglycan recognition protein [Streptomyces leeuwenhoekii]|uniref:peptidoglycan recognition protein family protein n=1 Tax=Streptomyces leeuwenhoekii TaxID=1437453 RepID=UPI0036876FF4